MKYVARLLILVASLCAAFAPSLAREQNDAPDAEVLGFSEDGYFFAYEEYAYDVVSAALISAIHVIDRRTNAEAEGFPIGALPETAENGDYPAMAGGFDPDPALLDTSGEPDLDALRRAVREAAQPKLDALGIRPSGRRVAGVPMTQRSPGETRATPLVFVLWPTIPGPIPDQQLSYTLDAKPDAEPLDCVNVMPPKRRKTVTFDVIATRTWPEIKDVARASTKHVYDMPKEACAVGLWVSDVYAPPGADGSAALVLYLTSNWESFTETARWHAAYVTLPDAPPEPQQ